MGLPDELHVDIMPVLLGDGLRLFEHIDAKQIQLKRIKVVELLGGRTHLRFRFVK
jgi:dihydrofolate reductase